MDLQNRGQHFVSQFFLASLLASEFNVDYDVAIKHDPIQTDDELWILWYAQMVLSPQNQYHTLSYLDQS